MESGLYGREAGWTGGRMPVLFVGHGSPMNAVEDNRWSRGFRSLAGLVPKPSVVLSVSAHWFTEGTLVMGNAYPETIHDFGGFPRELHEIRYPALGKPALARAIAETLAGARAKVTEEWGLDHGTWSVLRVMYPDARFPVVQLSIDATRPAAGHFALGSLLAPLRDQGVLILGSGNLVHNLDDALSGPGGRELATPKWAADFDAAAARALKDGDIPWLTSAPDGREGRMAHPTPDHYLPLLYCAGAADEADSVSFPIEGFDYGSISMRAVLIG